MAVSMFIKTGDGDNGDLRDNFIVCEPTDGVNV